MAIRPLSRSLQRSVALTLLSYGVAVGLTILISCLLLPWFLPGLVGVAFLASLLAPMVENWLPRPWVPSQSKAVFISGCDTGFGHLLAVRLHSLGLEVFAGCLFPEGEGAAALKDVSSNTLHVVPLDVTSDESVKKASEYVIENLSTKKLWAVVNNAGLNDGAQLMLTPVNTLEHLFAVNTIGVVRVTKAFLPTLCKDKGRVITVASAAGRYAYPCMVPYCMTKQATISFCEGLRIELERFGVKVVTIEPWMYKTPITNEDTVKNCITKAWESSPNEVKKLYPQNFIQKYKKLILRFLRFSTSDRPQDVILLLEEAVMAEDPKYSYMPGKLMFLIMFCFLRRFPKPLADALISLVLNQL